MDAETIDKLREEVVLLFTEYGLKVLAALAILLIGFWVAKGIKSLIQRLMGKRSLDPIIAAFVTKLVYVALLIFVVVAALNSVGINTTSFVAVVGAAGLAIGLALQGSLSNFAAGFLLIVFRFFKRGDYIEAAGTAGVVDSIHIFTTTLTTPDNKLVIVPNAKITSDNIVNYSAMATRRLDLVFGVSYSDDIDKVRGILKKIADADPRILKDPAPMIVISELADSSVNFILRVWVKTSDFWGVKFDTTEKGKKEFDAANVTIPFPQRDVHLFQESTS